MPARSAGSLILVSSFVLALSARAAAQPTQPLVAAPPAAPEFLSRYDFHLSIARLAPSSDPLVPSTPPIDERFAWDSHFGGSFDFADLVAVRLGVIIDYQAGMGTELRPFDPNQATYLLEGYVSGRVAANTEVAGIFHHISRHLSDRPKEFAVAYNELGARVMHHHDVGTTTVDVDVEGGRTIQHSYVDYTWLGEAQVLIRHPVNERFGVFAHGQGRVFGVNELVAKRGTQAGALAEAGVRIAGRGGILEVFAGYEKRVDADPLDRLSQGWALFGFRILSR